LRKSPGASAIRPPPGRAVLEWYDQGMEADLGELDWGAIMLTANPELGP